MSNFPSSIVREINTVKRFLKEQVPLTGDHENDVRVFRSALKDNKNSLLSNPNRAELEAMFLFLHLGQTNDELVNGNSKHQNSRGWNKNHGRNVVPRSNEKDEWGFPVGIGQFLGNYLMQNPSKPFSQYKRIDNREIAFNLISFYARQFVREAEALQKVPAEVHNTFFNIFPRLLGA
ncbi:MAG: hypothetical protein LC122_14255 [Chitinophagales bacterium]|nr:hypothetical protein [Chitinophagales bacterium]